MGHLTLYDSLTESYRNGETNSRLHWKKGYFIMDSQTIMLLVIGAVLLIALLLLFGTGVGMGGMAMMAGMMGTPIGWVILLVILALGGFLAWAVLYVH